MSKTSMNGRRAAVAGPVVSDVLPSVPLRLPFPGEAGTIEIVYSLQFVMGLEQKRRALNADLTARTRALNVRRKIAQRAAEDANDAYNRLVVDYEAALKAHSPMDPEERRTWRDRLDEADGFRLQTSDDGLLLVDELRGELEEINRESFLRVIGEVVVGIASWPQTWGQAPDPKDPGSWDSVPTLVLEWITSEDGGIGRVKEEMIGPLFGSESRPGSR